jgi:hypothetical protein
MFSFICSSRLLKKGFFVALFLFLYFVPTQAYAELEFLAYGIEISGESPICNQGTKTQYCEEMADALDFIISQWNWDLADTRYCNPYSGPIDSTIFVDDSLFWWGDDDDGYAGVDSVDVAFWCTHGEYMCNDTYNMYYSRMDPGKGITEEMPYSCFVQMGMYHGDGVYSFDLGSGGGNEEVKILIANSCHSLQRCAWWKSAYQNIFNESGDSFAMLGYHGAAWDKTIIIEDLEDFATNSRDNYLGDNWLDYLYHTPRGADNDSCPVVYIEATSSSDAQYKFLWAGLEDWKDPGNHSHMSFWYISPCKPDNGQSL